MPPPAPRHVLLATALALPALFLAPATVPVLSAGSAAPAVPAAGLGFANGLWGDDDTRESAKASALTGAWEADKDLGSLYALTDRTGAKKLWREGDNKPVERNLTGSGVTVALLDTGISPVRGLDAPGKVVRGADLSFDSATEGSREVDGFGHGTHMAAIIAGRDPVPTGKEDSRDHVVGVAPGARLVDVKIGAADGAADVSQVIAGVDWVVAHRDELGIRVLNLSYGTRSTQSWTLDPLAAAVDNAWRAGIVVVVSAGNDGAGTALTMPAANPRILAVGAVDHRGTGKTSDDVVADFTNPGTDRTPDVLAPGKSVVSLRAPGSNADVQHPEGLVAGDDAARLFRGSGTSQAAAAVSGAAALLLQADPSLTPDQVKGLLLAGAEPLKEAASSAGVIDVEQSLKVLRKARQEVPAYSQDHLPEASGLGSLEDARGDSHVLDPETGEPLVGEQDVFGEPWDRRSWSQASAQRRSWSGDTWNGATWTASSWSRRSWSGADFTRRSWSGADFTRRSWSGADFTRRSWSNAGWAG